MVKEVTEEVMDGEMAVHSGVEVMDKVRMEDTEVDTEEVLRHMVGDMVSKVKDMAVVLQQLVEAQ